MSDLRGFTDEAATEDLFNIHNYVVGLSKFIETCNTPMTISIQGTWGTGKTSIMNFINQELERDGVVHTIQFNTWQFSQFNMQDNLAVSLMSSMISQMKIKEENASKMKTAGRVLGAMGNVAWQGVRALTESKFGGVGVENLDKLKDSAVAAFTGEDTPSYDAATVITQLKKNFEQCVNDTLEQTKKERIVIFIDDLDRLEPAKAVELLEVMKLFFDCKGCVFVLAIDYEVVTRGVAAKYGRFSSSDEENEAKGKSFFDKIIQVPFKMPIGTYDFKNYIKRCFDDMGISYQPEEIGDYDSLLSLSIGKNPRSMKRLFNAFLLLTIVVDDEVLTTDRNKEILFALLCLQSSYEGMYNLLLRHVDELSPEFIDMLANEPVDSIEEKYGRLDLGESEENRFHAFMKKFMLLMDKDNSGALDDNEIQALKSVLMLSSITNASDTEDKAPTTKKRRKAAYVYNEKEYRSGSRHRDNIGNLAHDILADVIHKCGWRREDLERFRDSFYKLGGTGWLNEVVLFEDQVENLPNDEHYTEKGKIDPKDPETKRAVTYCIESFAHNFLNALPDQPGTRYEKERASEDPDALVLYDGTIAYTGRYWGEDSMDKLCRVLRDTFHYDVQISRKDL